MPAASRQSASQRYRATATNPRRVRPRSARAMAAAPARAAR